MKAVLFDLDGVLIDAKNIHKEALNNALGKYGVEITDAEHLSTYDGLTTVKKLQMLSEFKKLPLEVHTQIYESKQRITLDQIRRLKPVDHIVQLFRELKRMNIKIAVCTNSIRSTTYNALHFSGLLPYVDIIKSNEDVKNPKPSPDMYWSAMMDLNLTPRDCIVVEDSPKGIEAAVLSGCNYIRVTSPADVTLNNILPKLKPVTLKTYWKDPNMNIVIPMAGEGSRFVAQGYEKPKPLIDVDGVPMIQKVVESLDLDGRYIFIVRKEHVEKYNVDIFLKSITKDCEVVVVDEVTEGAACTVLLAEHLIDTDENLVMVNSDQYFEWDSTQFMYRNHETKVDGSILTFQADHPKWSYAKTDTRGFVTEVAEKKVISNNATVGLYYWAKGSDFVKYTKQMIGKDIRVNNEFYVAPVFNEAIADDKRISIYNVDEMWGLGTPNDLELYLSSK